MLGWPHTVFLVCQLNQPSEAVWDVQSSSTYPGAWRLRFCQFAFPIAGLRCVSTSAMHRAWLHEARSLGRETSALQLPCNCTPIFHTNNFVTSLFMFVVAILYSFSVTVLCIDDYSYIFVFVSRLAAGWTLAPYAKQISVKVLLYSHQGEAGCLVDQAQYRHSILSACQSGNWTIFCLSLLMPFQFFSL